MDSGPSKKRSKEAQEGCGRLLGHVGFDERGDGSEECLLRRGRVVAEALARRGKRVRGGPVLENRTAIDQLPQVVNWPKDAGAFVTLPEVYTENVDHPGFAQSNLGMYRVQLSGGRYAANREVGLHYQIHRSIGVHHAAAIRRGERMRVNVFVGGAPAMMLAAVMPLPEGLSELTFAGALAGRRDPQTRVAALFFHMREKPRRTLGRETNG